MIAKDLINYMIPPLKPEDSLDKAREWMEELKLAELPVANHGQFLGILDEEMLLEADGENTISDFHLKGQPCFVYQSQHYYEVLAKAQNLGFRLVAVLDKEDGYLGVVSVEDVVEAFAQTTAVKHPGAIMVISTDPKDYSLAFISQVAERNGTRILSSYLTPQVEDPNRYRLTLKFDREDVSQIATVLENSGYRIEARFNEKDLSYDEKERLDILMRYLKP